MTVFSRRDLLSLMGGAALVPAIGIPQGHAATRYIVIATGGTGGVFYPYGGGLAQLLSKKLPETQATAEVTGGSVDNVKLLGTGDAEIGFSTVDSASSRRWRPPWRRSRRPATAGAGGSSSEPRSSSPVSAGSRDAGRAARKPGR